jgi:hypothetical protein
MEWIGKPISRGQRVVLNWRGITVYQSQEAATSRGFHMSALLASGVIDGRGIGNARMRIEDTPHFDDVTASNVDTRQRYAV